MTHEGQGSGPHDAPPPPTSTHWSGPDSDDDTVPLPPFVPGRNRRSEPDQPAIDTHATADGGPLAGDAADTVLDAADTVSATPDAVAEGAETDVASTPEEDDPFPFDLPIEDESLPFYGWPSGETTDETPEVDLAALEEPDIQEGEATAPPEDPDTPEARGATLDETGDAAFDEVPPEATRPVDHADPSLDIADRLEALAHRLRNEGQDGIEKEMASLDRFTALVAGVVAGYLAGLRD
jgi:hypothetical protein